MYKVGEIVCFWGVKMDGLMWLLVEVMIGKVIGWQYEEWIYMIEG